MTIPIAYTLGLVVLLLAQHLFFVIPGSGNVWLAGLGVAAMSVPAMLQHAASRVRNPRTARILGRVAPALLPSIYAILLAPLGGLDVAARLAGESYSMLFAWLALPLLGAEVARTVVEVRQNAAAENLESHGLLLRPRIAFLGMFTLPWAVLAVAVDLVRTEPIGAFLLSTNTGLTIGTLLFAVALAVLMPLVFRISMGLHRRLPPGVADELRTTAGALGFRGNSLLVLESGLRTINALMIGPLPWPRYLVLTDGLLAILDLHALRGVVAHEVGHAQAGHPAMLLGVFVVSPLLLASLDQHVSMTTVPLGIRTIAIVVAAAVGFWALRRISHRFEHEADVLSAIALGGADPCIRALTRVGEVVMAETARATTLHPSERDRVTLLRRFAGDPAFRARFALRGLRLRRAIAAVVALSCIAATVGAYLAWPCERAVWLYGTGRLREAGEQVARVGDDVTAGQREWWSHFRAELDAAIAIAGPVDSTREELRDLLADEGWRRGVETLVARGGAAARPWMALATSDRERSTLRACVRIYCEAVDESDLATIDEITAHLRTLELPPELRKVFAP